MSSGFPDPEPDDPVPAADLLAREGWAAGAADEFDPSDAVWAGELLAREIPPEPDDEQRPRVTRAGAAVAGVLCALTVGGVVALRPVLMTDTDDRRPFPDVTTTSPPSTTQVNPPVRRVIGTPHAVQALTLTRRTPSEGTRPTTTPSAARRSTTGSTTSEAHTIAARRGDGTSTAAAIRPPTSRNVVTTSSAVPPPPVVTTTRGADGNGHRHHPTPPHPHDKH